MGLYGSQPLWPHLITFLVSFAVSAAIAIAGGGGLFLRITPDAERAVQSSHSGKVPRLGGMGVICATVFAAIVFFPDHFWKGHYYILVCAFPALYLATLEDIGMRVRPALRLAATFAAAGFYMAATGEFIPRVGIPVVDHLIAVPAFAFALSALLVTAAVQSMNLIDGLNGLCSGIAFLICVCLAYTAQASGQASLFYLSTTSAIAVLGFFVVNYPSGNLFLGDSGAYWIGFSLSLMAIYFLRNIETFSPPAMLLIFFWPAFDLSLTVRRRLVSRRRLFSPDRMHPHQIAVRLLRARLPQPQGRRVANPIASFLTLLLAAPPMILGAALWDRPQAAWMALIVCFLAYGFLYAWVVAVSRARLLRGLAPRRHPRSGGRNAGPSPGSETASIPHSSPRAETVRDGQRRSEGLLIGRAAPEPAGST